MEEDVVQVLKLKPVRLSANHPWYEDPLVHYNPGSPTLQIHNILWRGHFHSTLRMRATDLTFPPVRGLLAVFKGETQSTASAAHRNSARVNLGAVLTGDNARRDFSVPDLYAQDAMTGMVFVPETRKQAFLSRGKAHVVFNQHKSQICKYLDHQGVWQSARYRHTHPVNEGVTWERQLKTRQRGVDCERFRAVLQSSGEHVKRPYVRIKVIDLAYGLVHSYEHVVTEGKPTPSDLQGI